MSVFTDRTRESSTTTGTGAFTLSGTAPAGYQTFATAGLNGQTVDYCIEAVDANGTPTGDWEVGRGVYTSASNNLTRASILSSSNANAAVNFAAGPKNVFVTAASASLDIHAATSKATPVDADELGLVDSAASYVLKRLTWANLKATLKTYFDTLYPPRHLFACTVSAVSLGNDNAAHSIFPSANDVLTVEANTTYFFEAEIRITNGTTTHTDSFGFGGTATFTSIGYDVFISRNVGGTSTVTRAWIRSSAMTILNGTSGTAGTTARISGVIRTNGAGTIIPQWQFSADPTGTNQVEPNSYIRLQKAGSDTVASEGPWA